MNEKILIASDSTTDLSPELIERYGIKILPLCVALGDKQYTDGVDIDPDFIYKNYEETGRLPKTSAVNMADCEAFLKSLTVDGSKVIFFTISAEMSSTNNNARMAAEAVEGAFAVDTRNLSTGGGLLLIAAAEMAARGLSAEEIVKNCEELARRVDASFVIDSLEFLYKGGRCSALAALGANLLSLKPCIFVKDGKMGVGKKYRGKYATILPKYIDDRIGDASDIIKDHVFVTHAGCDDEVVNACVARVRELMPEAELHITRAGCSVSSHCGRNTLGVLFIRTHDI